MTRNEIGSLIDHTILSPDAGESDVLRICDEAIKYQFASVCVNSVNVSLVFEKLKGSGVKTCTVVGFPLGAMSTKAKSEETRIAVDDGAEEIDMVVNIGAAKDGKYTIVENDIKEVVKAAKEEGNKLNKTVLVKVILETCLLTDDAIVNCCICSKNAGADFVKTSTGFATPKDKDGNLLPNGATVHHVELMRKTVGSEMGVKASGGIRSAETAIAMINAGANRIGTSSGVKIVESF